MLLWRLCSSVTFLCIRPACTSEITGRLLIWILLAPLSKWWKPSTLSSLNINWLYQTICRLRWFGLGCCYPSRATDVLFLHSWDSGIVSICGSSILWNARGWQPQTAFQSLTVINLLQRQNSLDMCAICIGRERWTLRCLSWYLLQAFLTFEVGLVVLIGVEIKYLQSVWLISFI